MVKIVQRFCCKWDFLFLFFVEGLFWSFWSLFFRRKFTRSLFVFACSCNVTFYLYEIWWWFFDRVDRRIGIASHTGPRMISWLFSFSTQEGLRVFFEHNNLFFASEILIYKRIPESNCDPRCWFSPQTTDAMSKYPEKKIPQKSPWNSRTSDSTFKILRVLLVVTGLGEDVLSIQPLGAIFFQNFATQLFDPKPFPPVMKF